VLNVAWPFGLVGPDAVGGAEQVLHHLDAGLVEAGHRSVVVAREGSVVRGTLVASAVGHGERTDAVCRHAWANHRQGIERALDRFRVDVVHLHGIDFHQYLPRPGAPALATLHLPPGWYPPEVFAPSRARTFLHCVSDAQQRRCPPGAALLPVIENGVPTEALAARCARGAFALTLGRICPEKNFHVALDAARRADLPVLLAGEVHPYEAHVRYFREQIVPRLDERRRYLGPIGFAHKRLLMSAAQCVLIPTLAEETSSLVAMEALACGTPVIAFRSGALPDLIEHGVTGFLVEDEEQMAEAIGLAPRIEAEVCRRVACERFSVGRMTAEYLALYQRLAERCS
jgi:glycosyltransferase involved in cell wall biosynthesis